MRPPSVSQFARYTALLMLLVLPALSACGKKDDVQAIRQFIQEGAALAEKHSIAELLNMAAPEFTAQPGQYDRDRLQGVLFAAFQYYGRFKLHYPRPAVRLDKTGRSAFAALHFVIVNRDRSLPGLRELYDDPQRWLQAAGEMADLYHLELEWIKIDGDWKVTQAKLEGFKGF